MRTILSKQMEGSDGQFIVKRRSRMVDFWFGLAITICGCAIMLWSMSHAREYKYYVVYSFQDATGVNVGRIDITTKWEMNTMDRVAEVEKNLTEALNVSRPREQTGHGVSKLFLTYWAPIS